MTQPAEIKEAVGILIIAKSTRRCLFNIRAPYKSHALKWGIWGGMIENNESPKDALERELLEEMGHVPSLERIYPFDIFESSNKLFKFYTFVGVIDDEFIPDINEEACGYAWMNFGTWPSPLHTGVRASFTKSKSIDRLKMILDQH